MGASEKSLISPSEWLDSMLRLLSADTEHQELLLAHPDFPEDLLTSIADIINDLPERVGIASAIAANPNVPTEALRRMWEANSQTVWDGYGFIESEQHYKESAEVLAVIAGVVGDPLNVRHYLSSNFGNLESFVANNGAPCSRCRCLMKPSGDDRDVAEVLDDHQRWCNHEAQPSPGLLDR